MKTASIKNNNISNSHSLKSFFNKSGEGSFFYQSKEIDTPFFIPSTIQTKLTIGQSQHKYEKPASLMPPLLQLKKSPSKEKKLDSQEQDSFDPTKEGDISSSILKTFNDYKTLMIKLPDGDETITVEPRYWIIDTGRSENSEKLIKPHNKAHRHIKSGSSASKAMKRTRVGRGTPKEMEVFIQAVVNKAYENYIKKGKSVPKQKNLPLLGKNRKMWKDRIQEWINKNEVGVDCSGFAYHALLNARIAAYGKGAKQVKEFKKRFDDRDKEIPWEGTDTYGRKKNWSKIIKYAHELQPGDYLLKKASVEDKKGKKLKRTHIIVVQAVEVLPGTHGYLKITTVESSGVKGSYPIGKNKDAMRRIGPTKKTWLIHYEDKLSSIKGLKKFYFLRPKY